MNKKRIFGVITAAATTAFITFGMASWLSKIPVVVGDCVDSVGQVAVIHTNHLGVESDYLVKLGPEDHGAEFVPFAVSLVNGGDVGELMEDVNNPVVAVYGYEGMTKIEFLCREVQSND